MEFAAAFILLIAFLLVVRRLRAARQRARIDTLAARLADLAARCFLVEPCPRCHESEMRLVGVSPNARSLEYACAHCEKSMRAAAASPDAALAAELHRELEARLDVLASGPRARALDVSFSTPEAPMPYERTTRTPIAEAVRSEVWRRDLGHCVACGARQSLEFDHIIPLAKGGASSVRNLQLLCKACNLKKGAEI